MNLPRVDWVRAIIAVLFTLGLWGWVEARSAEARADVYAAENAALEAERDAARDSAERARERESVVADSLDRENARLAEENARMRAAREAERREAVERAERAQQAGDSLSAAIVDAVSGPEKPVVRELVREKDAQMQTERRAHAAQVLSLEAQMEDERMTAAERLRNKDTRILALIRRCETCEDLSAQQDEQTRLLEAEVEALRSARGAGIWAKVKPFLAGAAVMLIVEAVR